MKKLLQRMTAYILTVSMSLLCIPENICDALADEIQNAKFDASSRTVSREDESFSDVEILSGAQTTGYILGEDEKKRETDKEYLVSFANTGLSQWGNVIKYYLT